MDDSSKTMQTNTPLKIAEYIKDQIDSNKLKVGDKLPSERNLVKELKVSRSSVREAVKQLTTMGYLKSIERRGTFISKDYLDNKYVDFQLNKVLQCAPIFDLMEVRMLLEEKFIVLAIKRISREDIDNLKNILEKIKSSKDDNEEFFKEDLKFHYAIAKATYNEVITEIMKVITKRMDDNKDIFKSSSYKTRKRTIEDFEKIIYHLENGNCKEAEKLYYNHIHLVDDVLKEFLT